MTSLAQIEPQKANIVARYKGIPVLTTAMLAEFYGTDTDNIKQNYTRNKERFIEGKHFFKIVGDELKNFVGDLKSLANDLLTSQRGEQDLLSGVDGDQSLLVNIIHAQISNKVRVLILWTERGAARHAKMLDTNQAWNVFEQLEDCYFAVQEYTKQKAKSTPKDRENLRHAVSNLVSRVKINFSDAYIMVGQRFNVKSIEEIPLDQLDDAVEYVHGLILTFDKFQNHSPVDVNAIQDCHGVLQYRLIEYHKGLESEVKRLGGKMPEYPAFNPEDIAQALMSRILQGKQMMIKLNYQGGFALELVPRDAVMVDAKNIPELVSRTDLVAKEQIPLIMQSAMDRLVK
ncbi:ORF6N domain-containing protein [Acinetobacter sp. CS-2]|uniref:ORF6N domain-containing protein n=1 Tax=Acinetobacter sp. CS-2 TaxID=2798861 RepID=UPI001907EA96|nr:ORF6N domain-containing protein [Acinetobacter sp. CS-2]QQN40556.1 ORF6N domain-containing protein [Acinetobacter sp. CS-2]